MEMIGRWKCYADADNAEVGNDDRILLPGKEGSIHALMEMIGRWKCYADDDDAEVGDADRILLPSKEGSMYTCFDGNDRPCLMMVMRGSSLCLHVLASKTFWKSKLIRCQLFIQLRTTNLDDIHICFSNSL